MYSNWALTAAQDDTFVEDEFGMHPTSMRYRVMDATMGRIYFQRWLEESSGRLPTPWARPRVTQRPLRPKLCATGATARSSSASSVLQVRRGSM